MTFIIINPNARHSSLLLIPLILSMKTEIKKHLKYNSNESETIRIRRIP
jgi:hypothetical protein